MSTNRLDFSITTDTLQAHQTDCLVIGICEEKQLSNEAKVIDNALDGLLTQLIDAGDLTGKVGHLLPLINPQGIAAKRLLIVGFGKEEKLSLATLKKGVTAATKWIQNSGATTATFALLDRCTEKETSLPTLMEAVGTALYRFDAPKKEAQPKAKLTTIKILEKEQNKNLDAALRYGAALVSGMNITRDLANTPANYMTPTKLAQAAEELSQTHKTIKCTVMGRDKIEALGMGAFLGVAQGSVEEPRFIVLEYNQAEKSEEAPIVLVGKGVTFDTGGISIKPGAAMDEMKFDMGGAASVIGTFNALAQSELKVNVVGIIPATENMPSGNALKPGDVVTSMSGQTIEVLNTDAEGRLILCDALTYATRYKPKAIIDIATLTGAIIIALGYEISGLFSNDEALTEALRESAFKADDPIWPFPIWEEIFQPMLKSNFADMANISPGRGAGSITAACFLERFVEEYPWAHLDIAGTAWKTGEEKGASGRPVPLLLNFLKKYEA